ncbi:MAG: hypothetical protein AB1416_00710 [Actinomycetota bacterium]
MLVGVGVAAIAAVAAFAARHPAADRPDDLRAGVAAVILYGGLVAACGLGATVVNRPANTGYTGLLVAAGARRDEVAVAALAARAAAVAACLAVWGAAGEVASVALGAGLDGPLAVHALGSVPTMLLSLGGAALASAAFAPFAAAVIGVSIHVVAQALVNLKAASDAGVIGDVAEPAIDAAYAFLPRVVVSPMISRLQAADQAPLAAPRFEVNDVVVTIPSSGAFSVAWVLVWTAILAALAVVALRRRPL